MKLYKLFLLYVLALGLVFTTNGALRAQDDDEETTTEEQEMDEEEWQKQMDELNAQKTQLTAKLDVLTKEIDVLKVQSAQKDKDIEKCESDLMALVGYTKSSLAYFKKKFEETEKKINNKTGTLEDLRKMYFDEISNDKAKCLPEFLDRYASMKKKIATCCTGLPPETYTVIKGDCLSKISKMKWNNLYLWPALWDANKDGVVNKEQLKNRRHKAVTNPNLIYPGQVLRIPTLTDAQKKEAESKAKKYRKIRKHKTEVNKEEPKKE